VLALASVAAYVFMSIMIASYVALFALCCVTVLRWLFGRGGDAATGVALSPKR
jgi:hypothetical protein